MSFDPHSSPEGPLGTPPPPPTPPLEVPFEPLGVTAGTGIPRNIAAALACVFPLVGGIVFYFMDRRDAYVRLYALQSIVLGGVVCVLSLFLNISSAILHFVFHFIPFIDWLFLKFFNIVSAAVAVTFVVLWIPLIWNAYRGKTFEMPYLWPAARRRIPPAFL